MLDKNLLKYYSHEPAGVRKMQKIAEVLELEKKMNNKESLSILDIGCGNGHLAAFMAALGNQVTGIDENNEAVAFAQKQYASEGVVFSNKKLTEFANKFEVITAFEVCEHIPELNNFLNELKNKLNDNGLFLISVPNGWSLEEMVRHLVQHTSWGQKLKSFVRRKNILPKSNTQSNADSPHVHFWSYNKWHKEFTAAGFKIEKTFKVSWFFKQFYYLGGRRFVKPNSKVFCFLDWLDDKLVRVLPKCWADGWIIVMRKKY